MRWLINYIRQCFCKHELIFEDLPYKNTLYDEIIIETGVYTSQTCKKCGYHKTYKKF